jgi:hypothetical protein
VTIENKTVTVNNIPNHNKKDNSAKQLKELYVLDKRNACYVPVSRKIMVYLLEGSQYA